MTPSSKIKRLRELTALYENIKLMCKDRGGCTGCILHTQMHKDCWKIVDEMMKLGAELYGKAINTK